jgi:hypothetical protein
VGYCAEPTPEMGEYHVEVRRESFYLRGEDDYDYAYNGAEQPRHAIILYPRTEGCLTGTIEFLIEDIPKIRAVLDQVERVYAGAKE